MKLTSSYSLLCFLLFANVLFCAQLTAAPMYTITDVGNLGGTFALLTGINAAGQAVGRSASAGDLVDQGLFWDGATISILGALGNNGAVTGLNNAGVAVGYVAADFPSRHAAIWTGGSMQDIGTLGGSNSFGWGINNLGHVTGSATTNDGTGISRSFYWNGTTMVEIPSLGSGVSEGRAINDSDWITGTSRISETATHAFLWNGTTLQDLGTLGGNDSTGYAINAAGMVAGVAQVSNGNAHAFLWNGVSMIDLGTPGQASAAKAINNAGQVVGYDGLHIVYWDGITQWDLSNLIAGGKGGYQFLDAVGINDAGQIAVVAALNGSLHGLILNPVADVPEPGSWLLAGAGLAGLLALRRRRQF